MATVSSTARDRRQNSLMGSQKAHFEIIVTSFTEKMRPSTLCLSLYDLDNRRQPLRSPPSGKATNEANKPPRKALTDRPTCDKTTATTPTPILPNLLPLEIARRRQQRQGQHGTRTTTRTTERRRLRNDILLMARQDTVHCSPTVRTAASNTGGISRSSSGIRAAFRHLCCRCRCRRQ